MKSINYVNTFADLNRPPYLCINKRIKALIYKATAYNPA